MVVTRCLSYQVPIEIKRAKLVSGCDEQVLSDVMRNDDALAMAEIVHRAAAAIVASIKTTPIASGGDSVPTSSMSSGKAEGQAHLSQQKPVIEIDPIPAPTAAAVQAPARLARPVIPPASTPPVSQPASTPLQARREFSPLPSSPAQAVLVPQDRIRAVSVIHAPIERESALGKFEKLKAGLHRFWHLRVWHPERQALGRRIARFAIYGIAVWFAYVAVMIVAYRFVDPPASNLMLYNYLKGNTVHHQWVPLKKISPAVIKAVVVAEDAQFCRHWGIDFAAIRYAIEHARGGTPRGASTISMQTAKNMFLWHSKSYVRKVLEVPVTLMMELIWPKKRMLEIYLNIAEWGPGVFGIGAAARHHFKTTPANLGTAEAARLAASLPNPKVRRAGRPGPKTRRKANVIQGRARKAGYYTRCVMG